MLLIPIAGIVWWLGRLGLTAGNPGANRFGRDPLEPKLSAGPSGTTVAG
jgi:uncharacterized membrane protein YhaH (DUF805 family)